MASPFDQLVHELSKLPSIGEKTALRLALHIVKQPQDYGSRLARAVSESMQTVRFCEQCHHLSYQPLCTICSDTRRNQTCICVVEDIADLQAIEKSGVYRGHYHVLHGSLNPLEGIGPDQIQIASLTARLANRAHTDEAIEIIIATNPNVCGDATALYLSNLLKPLNVRVTKLASGLPVGTAIEFANPMTLSRAIEQRVSFL